MRQNSRGFNSYFLFIVLLLMGVAVLTTLNGADDDYTLEQFVGDMEAGRVEEVTINPNSEVPTGYVRVELKGGDVYATRFTYETIPAEESFFEAHRKYLDIHIMVSGSEGVEIARRRP